MLLLLRRLNLSCLIQEVVNTYVRLINSGNKGELDIFLHIAEEFFPAFTLETDSSYFVTDCQSLTEEEQVAAKQEFANVLNSNGVCKKKSTKVCDISNMAIICGERSKRSLSRNESSVNLLFDVKATKTEDQPRNCDQICQFLKIPAQFCSKLCVVTYKKFLKASVIHARKQLSDLFGNSTNRIRTLRFNVGQRRFEPDTVSMSDVIIQCEQGMVDHEGSCGELPFPHETLLYNFKMH